MILISGCLAHSISDHSVGLVGASGGVYAILGAHVAAIVIVSFLEKNDILLYMDANIILDVNQFLNSSFQKVNLCRLYKNN